MEGLEYNFEGFGSGTVISTIPERDAVTKEKFWLTEVLFVKKEEQTEYKHVFKFSASSIQMFYPTVANPLPALENFVPARFDEKFSVDVKEALVVNIRQMMHKCSFSEEEALDWETFLSRIPNDINDIIAEPFLLPCPQNGSYSRHSSKEAPQVDYGLRPVDIVTHKDFCGSSRIKVFGAQQDIQKLQPLEKGEFVVLQLSVTNCPQYQWDFVVAQVIGDVSGLDTTDADSQLQLQIYRPSTLNKLDSKFIQWVGDTNQPWKGFFSRGHVKAIVERQVQGKKLTRKSQKLIKDIFFLT